jgi:hypothetical protein
VGLVVGFAIAVASVSLDLLPRVSIGGWVFGSAAVLAVTSCALPSAVFALFPGAGQVIAGFFAGATAEVGRHQLHADPLLPRWLRGAFAVGVALGLLLWLTLLVL